MAENPNDLIGWDIDGADSHPQNETGKCGGDQGEQPGKGATSLAIHAQHVIVYERLGLICVHLDTLASWVRVGTLNA